jgi:hypothetical protein
LNKKLIILFIIILELFVTVTGCYNYDSDSPYFPVIKNEPQGSFLGDLKGTLVLEDGYLRLSRSYSDTTELIIWPYGYSLNVEGDDIRIINGHGQLVAHVGDNIYVVGGEVPLITVVKFIRGLLPFGCKGPYWLASDVWVNEN